MKTNQKRRFTALAASLWLAVSGAPIAFALSEQTYSWYFKPTRDGSKPQVIPEAAFISDYPVLYTEPTEEKRIYLTFDAGYENGNVEKILDILKEKQVPGAFFILPQLAKENTALVCRMKEEGHLVCNHTASHRDMSLVTDFDTFKAELEKNESIFYEKTGMEMDKYYRPPEGRFSERNLDFAGQCGYKTVFWSLAYADWDNNKQMEPAKALSLILSRTHPGCVALLHPTSATNAVILGEYIDTLKAKGYTFCSLKDYPSPQTMPQKEQEGETTCE